MKSGSARPHDILSRAAAVWRSLASWGREGLPPGWAPLKVHLIILVVGAVLPLLVFTMVLVGRFVAAERSEMERMLQANVEDLTGAVDREFETSIAALEVLAGSDTLAQNNLGAFYERAAIVRQQRGWGDIVLIRADGAQILNLLRPLGTPMPNVGDRPYFADTMRTRRPVVSNLYRGSISGEWVVAIAVPVIRDDAVRHVLVAIIYAKDMKSLVVRGTSSKEWTRALVDRNGLIAARTRAPDDYVGNRATPDFIARTAVASRGTYRDVTVEGEKVFGAFARAPLSGWTAAVATPSSSIEGSVWRSVVTTAFAGSAVLALGVFLALFVGRRIANEMAAATAAAEALAEGRTVTIPDSPVAELTRLAAALRKSARLLEERDREREHAHALEADARRQAEAANNAKDQFLAVLSHELRTPLTPVLAAVELLHRSPAGSGGTRQPLEIIRRNIQLQARLIDDLLDLTRIAQGKLELKRKPIEICTVIERAVEITRPDIEARRLHFGVDFKDPPHWVNGDPSRLQQVVWNLLTNAVKFTPEGGCVGLRCERMNGSAVIEVSDSGIGIEPQAAERIFDAFEQGGRAITRQFGGLGLGLAIVKRLVQMHEGTVSVRSAGAGRGATFRVELPLCGVPVEPSRPKSAASAESASKRILVVEDNGDTAVTMKMLLEMFGYEVANAGDVKQALSAIESETFDLLLSDLGLPDGTGIDLMREVRRRGYALKGIALSGYGQPEDLNRSRDAGFSAHLIKPVDADTLVETIAAVV